MLGLQRHQGHQVCVVPAVQTFAGRIASPILGMCGMALVCGMASVACAQTIDKADEADTVIAAMSQTYRKMGNRFLIRATIQKQVRYGQTRRDWLDREYRLVTDGARTRTELIVKGKPTYVVIFRDPNLSLYMEPPNGSATLPAWDPGAEPMRLMMGRLQTAFFQRFADLAYTPYAVTSYSMQDVKVGKERRHCHRMKLRPAADLPQTWQAELWIDADTFLVHRVRLNMEQQEVPGMLDEDVQFLEIVSGDAVPLELLDWQPPPETAELDYIPRYPP